MENKNSFTKKWEVSIIELQNKEGKKFKVTRRFPSMSISETKVFKTKEKAKKQFKKWLE